MSYDYQSQEEQNAHNRELADIMTAGREQPVRREVPPKQRPHLTGTHLLGQIGNLLAHNILTPLAGIQMSLKLLQRTKGKNIALDDYLPEIIESLNSMDGFIRAVTELSGMTINPPITTSLHEIVGQALKQLAGFEPLNVETHFSADPQVQIGSRLLEIVMAQIMEHCLIASPDVVTLVIESRNVNFAYLLEHFPHEVRSSQDFKAFLEDKLQTYDYLENPFLMISFMGRGRPDDGVVGCAKQESARLLRQRWPIDIRQIVLARYGAHLLEIANPAGTYQACVIFDQATLSCGWSEIHA
jgi:hypothetical protein